MGALSKNKGKRFERVVAAAFRPVFDAPGTVESAVYRSKQSRGATDGPDVVTPLFWVETKNSQKATLQGAVRQTLRDISLTARDHYKRLIPLIVLKRDRVEANVWLRDEDAATVGAAVGSSPQIADRRDGWVCYLFHDFFSWAQSPEVANALRKLSRDRQVL